MKLILSLLFMSMVLANPARAQNDEPATAVATFAGGCFWCMEPPFDKLDGVISTTSGYSGGKEKNPTYEDVSYGKTGHAESIQIVYDPKQITYEQLLWVYWHNTDPTTGDRQFCDRGKQYRPVIFFHDTVQRDLAWDTRKIIEKQERFKGKIVTQIVPFTAFYAAEDYHQDFYKKNPTRYYSYRKGCGRDARLEELWGDSAGHE